MFKMCQQCSLPKFVLLNLLIRIKDGFQIYSSLKNKFHLENLFVDSGDSASHRPS